MRRTNRRSELQVLSDCEVLVKSILLRNVTDVALEPVEVFVERPIIQEDLSLHRLKLAA